MWAPTPKRIYHLEMIVVNSEKAISLIVVGKNVQRSETGKSSAMTRIHWVVEAENQTKIFQRKWF